MPILTLYIYILDTQVANSLDSVLNKVYSYYNVYIIFERII